MDWRVSRFGTYAYASLSKIALGSGNNLEINLIGKAGVASWCNETPDELTLSKGPSSSIERRTEALKGSGLPGFQGMGWTEGYTELFFDVFSEVIGPSFRPYPTLA